MATKAKDNNLALWDQLGRTDPKHTKTFSRSGGFKGTAIKPIWIVQRLTELFGPCGKGWGIDEPSFQVVQGEGETLVYCTVRCWYDDGDEMSMRHLFGVGGDKVVTKRQSGPFCDDEAFKKAFTDAVGNAFKFLGVGADVHMGQFDDSKYVEAVRQEFAANDTQEGGKVVGITKIKDKLRLLKTAGDALTDLDQFNELLAANRDDLAKIKEANHQWWTGDGADFEGFKAWIIRRRAELAPAEENAVLSGLIQSMKQCETAQALTNWMAANETLVAELDGAESRSFQLAYELHESAIKQTATVAAG